MIWSYWSNNKISKNKKINSQLEEMIDLNVKEIKNSVTFSPALTLLAVSELFMFVQKL